MVTILWSLIADWETPRYDLSTCRHSTWLCKNRQFSIFLIKQVFSLWVPTTDEVPPHRAREEEGAEGNKALTLPSRRPAYLLSHPADERLESLLDLRRLGRPPPLVGLPCSNNTPNTALPTPEKPCRSSIPPNPPSLTGNLGGDAGLTIAVVAVPPPRHGRERRGGAAGRSGEER